MASGSKLVLSMKTTLHFAKIFSAFLLLIFGLATIRHTANLEDIVIDAVLIAIGLTILYTDWRKPKL
jgi:hypothetical protein